MSQLEAISWTANDSWVLVEQQFRRHRLVNGLTSSRFVSIYTIVQTWSIGREPNPKADMLSTFPL